MKRIAPSVLLVAAILVVTAQAQWLETTISLPNSLGGMSRIEALSLQPDEPEGLCAWRAMPRR